MGYGPAITSYQVNEPQHYYSEPQHYYSEPQHHYSEPQHYDSEPQPYYSEPQYQAQPSIYSQKYSDRGGRFFFPLYQLLQLPPYTDDPAVNLAQALVGIPSSGAEE